MCVCEREREKKKLHFLTIFCSNFKINREDSCYGSKRTSEEGDTTGKLNETDHNRKQRLLLNSHASLSLFLSLSLLVESLTFYVVSFALFET